MLLIRDVMHCKPGKVRPMVERFLKMAEMVRREGGEMRVLTDVSGERYWTVVAETKAESFEAYMSMGDDAESSDELEEIMEGYHDLVDHGRREIFTIEE